MTKTEAIAEIKEQRQRLQNLKSTLPAKAYENMAKSSNEIIESAVRTFNIVEDDLKDSN